MKNNYLAQVVNVGGNEVKGPLVGIETLADVINRIMSFVMPVGGIILLLVLIWGGYEYMMSGGASDKVKSAQAKLTTGIIGFILLVTSYILVKIIAMIFGISGGLF